MDDSSDVHAWNAVSAAPHGVHCQQQLHLAGVKQGTLGMFQFFPSLCMACLWMIESEIKALLVAHHSITQFVLPESCGVLHAIHMRAFYCDGLSWWFPHFVGID